MATEISGNRYTVDAVAKALDILEVFDGHERLSLGQIRQFAGLNKSRVFRMVQTLTERGYLERCSDGSSYRLGIRLAERAAHVYRGLKETAREPMLQLYERFHETICLGVLDHGGQVICVKVIESCRPFPVTRGVGQRLPSRQTALGRVMLAFLRSDYFAAGEPAAAIASPLYRELEVIRARGYAVCKEENRTVCGSIAAPILNLTGHPVAALSVSGPLVQVFSQEAEIAPVLMSVCRRISRMFGGEPAARMPGVALFSGHAGRVMAAR